MSLWQMVTGLVNPSPVVQVTTKVGDTFRGLLVDYNRSVLVLRAARRGEMDPQRGEVWTALLGDLVIPSDNVDYWQEGLDPNLLI